MVNGKIRILHLEDSETDAGHIHRMLKKAEIDFTSRVVDSRTDYVSALTDYEPHLIISDHSMPAFNSMDALEILRASGHDIPFILVTGAVSEEFAAQIILKGADDYILKDRPKRLPSSILSLLDKYNIRKAREKRETHLKNIFDGSLDILCSIDVDGKFVEVSAAAEGIWGYKPAELIGEKYINMVFKDDVTITISAANGVTQGATLTNFENHFVHKNGTLIPMIWSARWDDKVKIMYCVARDGTEKIRAEKELKLLANRLSLATKSAGMGTWDWDIKSNLLSWDDAMYRLYNVSPSEFMSVYDGWFTRIHPEDRPKIGEEMSQAIKGEKKYNTTFRIFWDDLSVHHIRATGIIENDESGNAIRMTGLNWDVTEKKNAENEIKVLNENLENRIKERTIELNEANRELEAFNYTVSHDLQAPLRAINGFAKILVDEYNDKLDAAGKECLHYISENTTLMGQLIRDLLEFAKLGEKQIVKDDVDMNEIVNSIIIEVQWISPDHSAELKIDDLGTASCDSTLIRQVWMNLISNAIKYSEKKEHPVIEIGTALINDQKTYYVKDNGAGFDMKYADNLFGVFKRLHSAEDFEGTGIGLATVRRILARHGGEVWAEGKIDEGATFYFTLPKT